MKRVAGRNSLKNDTRKKMRIYKEIRRVTIERLMQYYLCLREEDLWKEKNVVSSTQIADYLDMDDTQVRKDLALIGLRGRPRMGFDRKETIHVIRQVLGFDEIYRAMIVGAGGLGGAIARYVNFKNYGVIVAALVDNDPKKIGKKIGTCRVYPLEQLKFLIKKFEIKIGILTCPAKAAQEMANRLVRAGIQAIWNFAPINIAVPKNIILHHQHLSAELVNFTFYLQKGRK